MSYILLSRWPKESQGTPKPHAILRTINCSPEPEWEGPIAETPICVCYQYRPMLINTAQLANTETHISNLLARCTGVIMAKALWSDRSLLVGWILGPLSEMKSIP